MNGPSGVPLDVHAAQTWWADAATLDRFVRDVLQAELAALRPEVARATGPHWHPGLHWRDDLGLDSLDLMTLSSALVDAAGVRQLHDIDALYAAPTLGGWTEVARKALAATPLQQMRFRTSGSTGSPRSCVHCLSELTQEMQAMAAVIGPVQRIVTPVRCHHIYGFLFSVLLPRLAGRSAPVPVIDLVGRPPPALSAVIQPGDLVVGFPDWWQGVVRHPPTWPAGVVGLTSTAPCPDALGDALHASGLPRLLHIYGSTETAGIGWKEHGDPHYTAHAFWSRAPGQDDRLRRTGPDGRVRETDAPDHLDWLDDRHLRPIRRRDQVIQIGGVNVQPAWVAEQLRARPGVRDAVVRPLEQPGQPTRLKAFVVPDASCDPVSWLSELNAWCQRHLAPAARPVHITTGDALPTNALGKACDWPVGHQRGS